MQGGTVGMDAPVKPEGDDQKGQGARVQIFAPQKKRATKGPLS